MVLAHHDDIANAVAGAIVLASHHVRQLNFHVPTLGPGRAAYIGDYVAGIFDPAGGGSSCPPGGWEFGDPRAGGFDVQFGWTPGMKN